MTNIFSFLLFFFVGFFIPCGGLILGIFEMFDLSFMSESENIVFFMSLFIIFFSIIFFMFYYFGEGPDLLRFTIIFFSFTISMGLLINHFSVFTLFIAWDGLGISSFFLVAFYMNWSSMNGAMVTVLTNRFGDFCLFWFFSSFLNSSSSHVISLLSFFLFVGASTKSAQFPFSNWLPLAMAAPTPVSSLVHSSTLVTAGVFLLLRYYQFMENKNFCLMIFAIGLTTILLAGLSSLVEKDFKKIVALSTLSQMGLLFMSLGLSIPVMTFSHMIAHAFFKSCLFIQVGNMIVSFWGTQDSRHYSSSISDSQTSSLFMGVCLVSLCGLFFLSGFFSKESILMLLTSKLAGWTSFFLVWVSMALTFFYSFRLLWSLISPATNSFRYATTTGNLMYSSLLMLLGVSGGFFMLNNSPAVVLFFCGSEKFLPFTIMILIVAASKSWSKFFFVFKNMVFIDSFVSTTSLVNMKSVKMNDSFILSLVNWLSVFMAQAKNQNFVSPLKLVLASIFSIMIFFV